MTMAFPERMTALVVCLPLQYLGLAAHLGMSLAQSMILRPRSCSAPITASSSAT